MKAGVEHPKTGLIPGSLAVELRRVGHVIPKAGVTGHVLPEHPDFPGFDGNCNRTMRNELGGWSTGRAAAVYLGEEVCLRERP